MSIRSKEYFLEGTDIRKNFSLLDEDNQAIVLSSLSELELYVVKDNKRIRSYDLNAGAKEDTIHADGDSEAHIWIPKSLVTKGVLLIEYSAKYIEAETGGFRYVTGYFNVQLVIQARATEN